MSRLEGKVAIVTGAGSGNGRGITLGYAREGARVLAADLNETSAQETAELAERAGGRVEPGRVDVANGASVEAMVAQAERAFGKIDLLVANAGINDRMDFLDLTEEVWDRILDVNLKGVFLCGLHTARRMAQSGGGAIINIASINSQIAGSLTAAYCASKGGVQMLTRSMAVSLAPHRIRVNAIGPGIIETNLTRALLDSPDQVDFFNRRSPIGRIGTPDDLVGPAVFLASDESAYVTGHTLFVDGGILASRHLQHKPQSEWT
jgi:NAD(P)-dependent dehydrogenase (short-subunit alcohol dehydrogenase family)